MSKEPKEFEISRLLDLTHKNKYASTVAAFEIIDFLDQLEVPKKIIHRKPSIKALHLLSEKQVKWDYIGEEARLQLEEELRASKKAGSALDAMFGAPGSSAPMVDDSDEDLDEIVETEPPEQIMEEDEFDENSTEEDSSSDEDNDESADEEEDESDDSDDSDDFVDTDESDDDQEADEDSADDEDE